ncbi:MAG: fluoride efflux transporter CrcB [Longimicrobiales bacterium]
MTQWFYVAAGGALGAMARYGIASWLTTNPSDPAPATLPDLPWGTVVVNLVGCLLIGAMIGAGEGRDGVPEAQRLFLMIGVLGGFTTFSAFGLETVSLFRSGNPGLAGANVALQVFGGLLGVWAGWAALR